MTLAIQMGRQIKRDNYIPGELWLRSFDDMIQVARVYKKCKQYNHAMFVL